MKKIKCPQCGEPSIWDENNRSRPFCSERCKLIDLGAWASEEYQIPASPSVDDLDDYTEGGYNENSLTHHLPEHSPNSTKH